MIIYYMKWIRNLFVHVRSERARRFTGSYDIIGCQKRSPTLYVDNQPSCRWSRFSLSLSLSADNRPIGAIDIDG